jgi:hypothetical protein
VGGGGLQDQRPLARVDAPVGPGDSEQGDEVEQPDGIGRVAEGLEVLQDVVVGADAGGLREALALRLPLGVLAQLFDQLLVALHEVAVFALASDLVHGAPSLVSPGV